MNNNYLQTYKPIKHQIKNLPTSYQQLIKNYQTHSNNLPKTQQ
jgi:hypothetical protein